MKSFLIKNDNETLVINNNINEDTIINKELYELIQSTKSKIDNYINEWDKYKKNLNVYECIYTSNNSHKNICNINPVSRSFFKMIEIIKDFNIPVTGKISCIAEAPGGFIESFLYQNKGITSIHGITLLSRNKKIPYWNPQLCKEPLLNIHKGKDNTGDIYNFENSIHFINKVERGTCDIVTGDGGFDYSTDFNNQEKSSYKLILNEILIALNIQKKGGIFICKMFDLFYTSTLKLIYILYLSYEEVFFIKPLTSRPSNSEKYIICKGFKGYNKQISNILCINKENDILPIQISDIFLHKIKEYNLIFIKQQIHCINQILINIKNKSYNKYIDNKQVKIIIDWCKTYNMPINTNCIYLQ